MDKYAKLALEEYNSEACAVHPGVLMELAELTEKGGIE